jgi:hypothetical protein
MRVTLFALVMMIVVPACRNADDKLAPGAEKGPHPGPRAVKRDFEVPNSTEPYLLRITAQEIACEHPKRKRESVRWDEVHRVWFVTTSDGPWLCDNWLLFEAKSGFCSVPTEAQGFDKVWAELKRFPELDYKPIALGGTDEAKHLVWKKNP